MGLPHRHYLVYFLSYTSGNRRKKGRKTEKKFFRRLRLREFFLELEENETREVNNFRSPSTWMPPMGRDASLEAYVKGVRSEILRQLKRLRTRRARDNLSIGFIEKDQEDIGK